MIVDYIFKKNTEALQKRIKEKNLKASFVSACNGISGISGDDYSIFRMLKNYFFIMGSLGAILNLFTSYFNPVFIAFYLVSFFTYILMRSKKKTFSESVYKLFRELDFNLLEDTKKHFTEYSKNVKINQEEFDEYSKLYRPISKNEKDAFDYFVSLIKEVQKIEEQNKPAKIPTEYFLEQVDEKSISFSNEPIGIIDSKLNLNMNNIRN